MKTTILSPTAFLLLATLAFSSCILLASAQDEEWYDPNAEYVPNGYTAVNGLGYYLNCADADKNYFTLQKLHKCQDPYVLSSQDIQTTNGFAGYIERTCRNAVGNANLFYELYIYPDNGNHREYDTSGRPMVPGYPGYPWTFAQIQSTEETSTTSNKKSSSSSSKQSVLDSTPAFLQHKMKQYAANAAAIEAAKQQKQHQDQQDQVLLETEAKTKTTQDDGNGPFYGYYTQEECLNAYVRDPAFRDPVTATDIERLIAFDLLFIVYSAQQKAADPNSPLSMYSTARCREDLLPMFVRTGHFPGNGVTDNASAKYTFLHNSVYNWYEWYVSEAFDYMCNFW